MRGMDPDVEPGQVWKKDSDHVYVESVHNGLATVQRCTPAGRVLNPRYRPQIEVEKLIASYKLVKTGWASKPISDN
jgi:hypothetical protein